MLLVSRVDPKQSLPIRRQRIPRISVIAPTDPCRGIFRFRSIVGRESPVRRPTTGLFRHTPHIGLFLLSLCLCKVRSAPFPLAGGPPCGSFPGSPKTSAPLGSYRQGSRAQCTKTSQPEQALLNSTEMDLLVCEELRDDRKTGQVYETEAAARVQRQSRPIRCFRLYPAARCIHPLAATALGNRELQCRTP